MPAGLMDRHSIVAIILIGSLVLALFASRDLSSWAERLGGGPLAEQTQSFAARWDQTNEQCLLRQEMSSQRGHARGDDEKKQQKAESREQHSASKADPK
jgi:hypothetical protein